MQCYKAATVSQDFDGTNQYLSLSPVLLSMDELENSDDRGGSF